MSDCLLFLFSSPTVFFFFDHNHFIIFFFHSSFHSFNLNLLAFFFLSLSLSLSLSILLKPVPVPFYPFISFMAVSCKSSHPTHHQSNINTLHFLSNPIRMYPIDGLYSTNQRLAKPFALLNACLPAGNSNKRLTFSNQTYGKRLFYRMFTFILFLKISTFQHYRFSCQYI